MAPGKLQPQLAAEVAALQQLGAPGMKSPADLDVLDRLPLLPKGNFASQAVATFRATWDRYLAFKTFPCTATPAILIGIITSLAGTALFGASLASLNLEEVEKFLGNVPLTFMLSLVMIRTGFHAINSGVHFSDDQKRTYNETVRQYYTFIIRAKNGELDDEATFVKELAEVKRMDVRLDDHMRIFGDTPLKELVNKSAQEILANHVPKNANELAFHSPRLEKWYQIWHDRLPRVGKMDAGLGVLMFFVALIGVGMMVNEDLIPSGFDLITEDPYLSTSFVLILFLHSATCIHAGSQMINYNKREERRQATVEQLAAYANDQPVAARQIEMISNKYTKLGKIVTNSKLALAIMIIVSLALVALGTFYMVSTQEKIPSLEPITINETINLPFATGIILSGFYGLHRASSFSEKGIKAEWKKKAEDRMAGIREVEEPRFDAMVEGKKNWLRSLPHKVLWAPHAAGGIALLCWGIIILLALKGKIEIPDELKPGQSSYSYIFASTLIIMAFDTFNTAYRMATYNGRKEDDSKFVELLARKDRRQLLAGQLV